MNTQFDAKIRQLFMDASGFEGVFEVMDRLHDAASAGMLPEVTDLDPAEVVGWLRDMVYTINETIREIESPTPDDAFEVYLDRCETESESVITHGGMNA